MNNILKNILNWIKLARLPFHIAGILPFMLGSTLAWHINNNFNWTIFGWSILAVEFILIAVHYSSEYFDYDVDALSAKIGKNKFSGGSQILQSGIIQKNNSLVASLISLIPIIFIGLMLQFYYNTGSLTIPLGIIGLFCGISYSAKPIRLAYRGFGEIIIGFCYGWLTLASAYYLQTGKIAPIIYLTAIPVAISIFNVILINEFPDYIADKKSAKNNLVVRFGQDRMKTLYAINNLLICLLYPLPITSGMPISSLIIFFPFILLSLRTSIQIIKGDYKDNKKLEKICAKTLIINLAVSISPIIAIFYENLTLLYG